MLAGLKNLILVAFVPVLSLVGMVTAAEVVLLVLVDKSLGLVQQHSGQYIQLYLQRSCS